MKKTQRDLMMKAILWLAAKKIANTAEPSIAELIAHLTDADPVEVQKRIAFEREFVNAQAELPVQEEGK